MRIPIEAFIKKRIDAGHQLFARLDQASGKRLSIITNALAQYTACRSADAASSLAYWWFFSLFPLIAILVTVASFFIDPSQILDTLLNLISPVLPFSQEELALNIIRFIRMRGTFGVIGTLGFLWSASNVFMILYTNINLAWDKARFRNFLQKRLIALGMVAVILLLLILFLFLTTVMDVLRQMQVPFLLDILNENSKFMRFAAGLSPTLATLLIFFILYRFIPNTRVPWIDAFWAAAICTAVWELTSKLFSFYLNSGLASYDFLFGSLATIAVLMLWFYLNSEILLLGAHISSAAANRRLSMSMPQEGNRNTV